MAAGIRRERLTARIDGPFVVFPVGLRSGPERGP